METLVLINQLFYELLFIHFRDPKYISDQPFTKLKS